MTLICIIWWFFSNKRDHTEEYSHWNSSQHREVYHTWLCWIWIPCDFMLGFAPHCILLLLRLRYSPGQESLNVHGSRLNYNSDLCHCGKRGCRTLSLCSLLSSALSAEGVNTLCMHYTKSCLCKCVCRMINLAEVFWKGSVWLCSMQHGPSAVWEVSFCDMQTNLSLNIHTHQSVEKNDDLQRKVRKTTDHLESININYRTMALSTE